MIRHVAVFTLKDGVDVRQITRALDELRERVSGPTSSSYGPDAGLRSGNGGFATCFDFADEAAFRAWDTNPEHERIRREKVVPLLTAIQRCQFRIA
jgi:hypothetical protein